MYLLEICPYCISIKDICQRGKHYYNIWEDLSFFVHTAEIHQRASNSSLQAERTLLRIGTQVELP